MPYVVIPSKWVKVPDRPVVPSLSDPIGRYVTAQILPITMYREEVGVGWATRIGLRLGNAGKYGRGYSVSGTGGCYWAANNRFCSGASDFSIEVIFTIIGTSAQFDRIFERGGAGGGSGGWDLEFGTSGNFINFTTWGAPDTTQVTPTLTQGYSYHMVITRSGTSIIGYIDGDQYATSTRSFTTSLKVNNFFMCYDSTGANTPDGILIHAMRFYDATVLSAAEVKQLATAPFAMYEQPIMRSYFSTTAATLMANPMFGGGAAANPVWGYLS